MRLDLATAAVALGVSTRTLMRYIKAGMPHERDGNRIVIPVEDAQAWIALARFAKRLDRMS